MDDRPRPRTRRDAQQVGSGAMRTRIALTAAVAALALVAVGCGGTTRQRHGSDGRLGERLLHRDHDVDRRAADGHVAVLGHVEPLAGRPRVGRGRRQERDRGPRRRAQRARRARDGGRRGDPVGARLALDDARDGVREHRGDRRGRLRPHRDPERDHGGHGVAVGDGDRVRGDAPDDRRRRRGERAPERARGLARVRRHLELTASSARAWDRASTDSR